MTFACTVSVVVVTVALLPPSLLYFQRWGLGVTNPTSQRDRGRSYGGKVVNWGNEEEDEGLQLIQTVHGRIISPSQPATADTSSLTLPIARFFKSDAIETALPLPPKNYPNSLKGMLWMDQEGVYGQSNRSTKFHDLVFTFGGTDFDRLDERTRKVSINSEGPAWVWWNDAQAYFEWFIGRNILGFFFEFEFNEDYTFAQIVCVLKPFAIFPKIRLPFSILNATMVLQTPEPGQCPPSPTTPKEDIGKCAKWRRETWTNGGPFEVYYIWEVVDNDRKRVQPYYDQYLSWANKKTDPSPFWAQLLLGNGLMSMSPKSAFVGLWNKFPA